LRKGDCVSITLPNCPQFMIAHFGTLLAGGVVSGCSPLLSPNEMVFQLDDSESKFFITLDAIYENVVRDILERLPKLECVITTNIADYAGIAKPLVIIGKIVKKIPKGKVIPYPGKSILDFKEVMESSSDVKVVSINVDKDLALLSYTGGTTGLQKGTELTHANIIANMFQISNWLDSKEENAGEVNISVLPFFHIGGLIQN
ncbi:MAG: AMP-binding protein, partial [Promethearchaeota archaeon]